MKRGKSLTSDRSTEANGNKIIEENIFKILQILPNHSNDLKQCMVLSLDGRSGEIRHDSVEVLLDLCCDLFYEASYGPCLSTSEVLLDLAWEKLNSFHWKDVPLRWQKVYSFACMFKACSLGAHAEDILHLREICRVCDMGLLMGFNIMDGVLHKIIHLHRPPPAKYAAVPLKELESIAESTLNCISRVSSPSLTEFNDRMKLRLPFIVENCIDHWPARTLWNFNYLNDVAGHRLVPIELGSKYTDDSWGQTLMTITDFIKNYITVKDSKPKAYLAQHRLFDQIPELRNDIYIPDYCSLSELDQCNAETDTEINAWFGPSGTVSPCHYDIKHNLLTQVTGHKYVRLYSPSCQKDLYPRSGMLHNTSAVEVENPDNELHPLFAGMDKSNREEFILGPGQMLYIPPKYWHYIRSLDESFSVSFWWV